MRVNATKVLVEDIKESEEKSKGGILLPTAVIKQDVMKGRILVVGDGTKEVPMLHRVGDVALYHPRAGNKFTWEEKEYRLIDVSEIFLSTV